MTQRERLLTYISRRLLGEAMFPERGFSFYEKTKEENLELGDFVMCSSSGIHTWTIGILLEKGYGFDVPWVIKDIYSDSICNVSNDSFYKLPNEWFIDEYLLKDKDYHIYEKCIKAIKRCEYGTLYKGISVENNICTLQLRRKWSREVLKEVSFPFNSKTTIKSIANLIESKDANEVKLAWES